MEKYTTNNQNSITVVSQSGQEVVLEAHDLLGSVTLNGHEIDNLDNAKVALNLIIRAMATMVDRGNLQ